MTISELWRRSISALLGGTPPYQRVEMPPFTFWEWRAGKGTPVVLIHGLSGSAMWWRRNLPALAQHHLVAAVDLVGFGRNRRFWRPGPLPLPLEEVAAVVARWIETTFSEPVHVVGHSMGGQVAIHLADVRGDLVRSLTLVGSTGLPFTLQPRSHLRNLPRPPAGLWSFSRLLAWDFLRAGPTSVAVASARLLTDDAREAMRRIHVPTLLVWGDRDPLVPELYAERMQQEIPDSAVVVIPEAGHVSMWDNAESFNREVLSFFQSVERQELAGKPETSSTGFNWALRGCVADLCYRQSSEHPTLVMIHGLGMSSAYFRDLAAALYERGLGSAAMDLAGFGYSNDAPPRTPREHARSVLRWCDEVGIDRVTFLGHSTGCHIVQALAEIAPHRVAGEIYVAPIWTNRPAAGWRMALGLARDVFREPPRLIPLVVSEYWRTGFIRWFRTFLLELPVATGPVRVGVSSEVIAGRNDPLTDRERLNEITGGLLTMVAGAHAVVLSYPEEVAKAIASSATLPLLQRE